MTVPIRPVRPDELDTVGQLLLTAYDAVGSFDAHYRDFLADPARWVPGTSEVLVAVDADDARRSGGARTRTAPPLGCVAFVRPGDAEFEPIRPVAGDAGFRFLAVAPHAQGRGVGEALVRACIDRARGDGARRMVIHSMAFMTAAHRLYERLGFVHRPDLDVVFPAGVGHAFTLDLADDADDHFPAPGPVPATPPWFEDAWGLRAPDDSPIC